MKPRKHPHKPAPQGKVLVLTAFLMTAFMGLAALVVDIGVIATARAQLKTVADSAALAGARQLATTRRLDPTVTNLNPEIAAATSYAISTGQNNSVLTQQAVVKASDIQIGYLDPNNPSSTLQTGSSYTMQFNSVQVTATRSSDHAGVIPALFSSLLGYGGSTISVTSTATVEIHPILNTGSTTNGLNGPLLPFAMSLADYNNAASNPSVFPSMVAAGNFGALNIPPSNNSTQTLNSQITGGIAPSDMQTQFPPNGTVNVGSTYSFAGNPGISNGDQDSLNSIIGQARLMPVWSSVSGNGNNSTFTVSQWVVVQITAVDLTGNPKTVSVAPAVLDYPGAVPQTGTGTSIGWNSGTGLAGGGVIVLHLSR
jgi:Flp pilus assembly protein TadG